MEESELIKKRKEKIASLQEDGINLYPNDVPATDTTQAINERFGQMDATALETNQERVAIAGRLMAVRNFGKASFVSVQDRKGESRVTSGSRTSAIRPTPFLKDWTWATSFSLQAAYSGRKPAS